MTCKDPVPSPRLIQSFRNTSRRTLPHKFLSFLLPFYDLHRLDKNLKLRIFYIYINGIQIHTQFQVVKVIYVEIFQNIFHQNFY